MRQKNQHEKTISEFNQLKKSYDDLFDLSKDLEKEADEELELELAQNIQNTIIKLKDFELCVFLDQKNDPLDCYIEVHAGAGGTESQDWAEMLRRMYVKWAEKKNFKYDLIHETKGEEAGIKSSTIKITGLNLYGFLKRESGIHRLVRISHLTQIKEGIQVLQVYGYIQLLMMTYKSKLMIKI